MGQQARTDLDLLRAQKEKEVDRQGQALKQLQEDLNTRGAQMAEGEKKEKTEQLQRIYKDYQRLVADAKEDIAREDRELVATILKAADDILKDAARKKKFSIILKDPNVIGYLDPEVDITDDVLKALNQRK
jgi:outer membrane protein